MRVAARAAIALHNTVEDYHTSGAWNALGVAALGAHLRGQSAETLRHALGIAEYHGPRSQMMREIANPTMLHDGSGMGALVGAMACLLAEDGFQGAPAITVEAVEVAPYWADLGQRWTILENYIKPYPICRWAHAALDALGAVMTEHDLSEAQDRAGSRCAPSPRPPRFLPRCPPPRPRRSIRCPLPWPRAWFMAISHRPISKARD